ncbi:NADH:ubiquinone reductase (Na(+)-transporting) subunit B [Engelhardtia mirabilis]|uniref:Na(+)-translocating NADH-quinone reductase subunit B n=1 Tax=Engelhardtia mirabilis TaxID=2528011 RepID=A0A518BKL4_9BACT|nr:Na(+)-translocating NADH-quinone reductase subunit B [Planctomycetes bacterium Pla133]QDV01840.1 Na(+)-translocating NADH-quinone reductase subunit B [Planctomycetes bacterium Pla86]
MQFLREQLDKVEPHFHKGGKLEKLYPFFEAADTFLYTPGSRTQSGPHVRDAADLKRTMIMVVLALIPATVFGIFNAGYWEMHAANPAVQLASLTVPQIVEAMLRGAWAFLPMYAVTIAVGGLLEALFSVIRKHEINEGFLVTSLLFPLTLPPDTPLWQVGLGIAFGVVIGKEVFGGTGMNILNPALTARIFLYFAYPAQMSGDLVWVANNANWVDGFSGATPLGTMFVHGADTSQYLYTWWDAFWGFIPGSVGETSFVACLIGAVILIATGVGSWRIMLSCTIGMVLTVLLLNAFAPRPTHYMAVSPQWHLVVGSFAFGTVFMATDPVSAAQTNLGRWIYGFGIGALMIMVRVLNPAYPAGIMLAIIFMNVFAPLIDYYVTKANIRRREVRLGLQ